MDVIRLLKFGILGYGILTFAAAFFFLLIYWILHRLGHRRLSKLVLGIISLFLLPCVLLAGTLFYAYYIEPNWVQVSSLRIESTGQRDFPSGAVIAHLADLHIERFGYRERKILAELKKASPDLILISGDFINSKKGVGPCRTFLQGLKAPFGVYAVLGNIDQDFFRKDVETMLDEVGIPYLAAGSFRVDLPGKGTLWIAGVSFREEKNQGVADAFQGVPLDAASILLTHGPDIVDLPVVRDYKPMVVLAGHTHGGQFGLPGVRKLSDYIERSKYMAGYFDVDGLPLYVNRGMGMKGTKLRFLSRPEMLVVRLVRQK